MQEHCRAVADAFNQQKPPKCVSFLEAWVIHRFIDGLPANQQVLAVPLTQSVDVLPGVPFHAHACACV